MNDISPPNKATIRVEIYNPYKNILRMGDSEFYTGLLN